MFSAYAPRHRCFIPGCDTDWSNSTFKNDIDASYRQFALPTEHQGSDMFKAAEAFDPCNMFEHNLPYNCQPESFDNSSIVACESFVYDLSIFPETLTTKLDLVSYTLKTRLEMHSVLYPREPRLLMQTACLPLQDFIVQTTSLPKSLPSFVKFEKKSKKIYLTN
jgi:hypothetical protein